MVRVKRAVNAAALMARSNHFAVVRLTCRPFVRASLRDSAALDRANSSALYSADRHIAMRPASGFESLHPSIRVAASMPMSGPLPTRKRVSLFETRKWMQAAALAVMIGTGAAHAQSDKMTFTLVGTGGNCSGCEWIQADGVIASDSAADLEKMVTSVDRTSGVWNIEVRLNSPGGSFMGGIKLGETMRLHGMSTSVGKSVLDNSLTANVEFYSKSPGTCQSACAIAFLGGVEREAATGSLGIHQFYSKDEIDNPTAKLFSGVDMSVQQILSSILIDYVNKMGVDPRFVSLASQTTPDNMRFLNQSELASLKVTWSAKAFRPWRVESSGAGAIAMSTTQDDTVAVSLLCRKDRVPRLFVKPDSKDVEWFREEVSGPWQMSVLGVSVPPSNRATRVSNGQPILEFALPGFDPRRLVKDSLFVGFGDGAPMSVIRGFSLELSDSNAASAMTLALKNCI
jgi:hypothetical protein